MGAAQGGKVWLVGAGPGDPGLITVRGREALEQADAVLYDALSHPALLLHCREGAELRDVGKRAGEASAPQAAITDELVSLARAGKQVVRLKGGDPLLFARGGEELAALADAGIAFEIVPGISSPVGAAAYAGIPLTHRTLSSSVTFITGSDRAGQEWSSEAWKRLATATDTLCILMGMRRLDTLTQALLDGGRRAETPAAVIEWGTRPEQRVLVSTLGALARGAREAGLKNPAVVIIGEVVSLREQLRWYDQRPLFGQRLLVPRAAHQALGTADAIRRRGAEPVSLPLIRIVDPPERAPLDAALDALARYQWVLFTSANGVTRFFDALRARGRDVRALGGLLVGAIGPKTAAAVVERGINPDVVADTFIGEALAEAVLARGVHAERPRVLVARALEARDALPRRLREAGCDVDVVPVYQTLKAGPDVRAVFAELLTERRLDAILFTSSSTVDAVVDLLGREAPLLLKGITLASIGPVTSETLRSRGLVAHVEAEQYTVDGLLDALEVWCGARRASGAPSS